MAAGSQPHLLLFFSFINKTSGLSVSSIISRVSVGSEGGGGGGGGVGTGLRLFVTTSARMLAYISTTSSTIVLLLTPAVQWEKLVWIWIWIWTRTRGLQNGRNAWKCLRQNAAARKINEGNYSRGETPELPIPPQQLLLLLHPAAARKHEPPT